MTTNKPVVHSPKVLALYVLALSALELESTAVAATCSASVLKLRFALHKSVEQKQLLTSAKIVHPSNNVCEHPKSKMD